MGRHMRFMPVSVLGCAALEQRFFFGAVWCCSWAVWAGACCALAAAAALSVVVFLVSPRGAWPCAARLSPSASSLPPLVSGRRCVRRAVAVARFCRRGPIRVPGAVVPCCLALRRWWPWAWVVRLGLVWGLSASSFFGCCAALAPRSACVRCASASLPFSVSSALGACPWLPGARGLPSPLSFCPCALGSGLGWLPGCRFALAPCSS